MNINFLIIGQGLAGSLLAMELMRRRRKVIVIDNGRENASKVSAGLINPVTGMRLVKSADIDQLLSEARRCYLSLSHDFQRVFFHEKPMLRIFRSQTEKDQAMLRLNDPDYRGYLGRIYSCGQKDSGLHTPFGFLEQKQTGHLLTRSLLECLKNYFIEQGCYRLTELDYRDIDFSPSLKWQDLYAERIIFCEGHRATENPWFSWLPFQPAKGEILTLDHRKELPDRIMNFGHWLIPTAPRRIRVGSTFDWKNPDTVPTEAGKNELLKAVGRIAPGLQVNLIEHQANVRPGTLDKQPFIGLHPQLRQLAIFNGFGARGSLSIPGYSRQFADFLLKDISLPQRCDIQRYYATHFTG
ncbi:MAG: NAD(P)/FAD-dependent oxidoreductase [Methylosarcina sp.]